VAAFRAGDPAPEPRVRRRAQRTRARRRRGRREPALRDGPLAGARPAAARRAPAPARDAALDAELLAEPRALRLQGARRGPARARARRPLGRDARGARRRAPRRLRARSRLRGAPGAAARGLRRRRRRDRAGPAPRGSGGRRARRRDRRPARALRAMEALDPAAIAADRARLRRRWAEAGHYAATSISQALAEGVRRHPDVEAAFYAEGKPRRTTNRALFAQGLEVAAALRARGVRPRDVVAVQLPSWLETAALFQGIAHAGAVVLPIVSIYGRTEVE